MIVVDSSVWIDFFNGKNSLEVERLEACLGVTPIAIGDLILVEVLQGFRNSKDMEVASEIFSSLGSIEMLADNCKYKAVENYRYLRSKGITVRKTIDGIIATACIETKLPLLFSDRDFLPYVEHLGLLVA